MTPQPEDTELLRRYAKDGEEQAFAELVSRHINLVYAGALRRVGGDKHLAEDVTQRVFTALAAAAGTVASRAVLAGWLHTTTRFQAAQVVRTERRRQAREQEVHAMNESTMSDPSRLADWERLRPVLDDALDELGDRDREAVLLRFIEGRSYAEVGARVGLTENAARMRVERALERMHGMLKRRGMTSTVGALSFALTGEATVTAPAGLAAAVTGSALSGAMATAGAAGGLTLLSFMNSTKIVTAVAAVIVAIATGVAYKESNENSQRRAELETVRQGLEQVQGRLASTERSLAEERLRTQAAEEDTRALLVGIERAKAATEATANAPITQETVEARYKRAQELVWAGNWEAALPELLWCFDEGMVRVDRFSGVRLGILLTEIGRMATNYPPALAALRERRDRAELRMESSGDLRIALEYAALNATLGEDTKTLALFDKLPEGDPRRQGLVSRVYDQLIGAKRYADAAAAMSYSQMTTRFTQVTRDIPAPANSANEERFRSGIRQLVITSTAKNLEVLAGAGKLDEARDLLGKLLAYDGSREARLVIREHVTRAGHPDLIPAP